MSNEKPSPILFWGCFIALVATAFSFVSRGMVLDEWGTVFALTESDKGRIAGAGLWPFAVSIVLFSLIIDRIGYKIAMFFGLACHIISTIILITTQPGENAATQLYIGSLIVAFGNGTVEAFINPVVATMYSREKTKWLNILHAGWPGGLVIGGLIILFAAGTTWQFKVGLILLPAVI
ncbi:MAG: MFS transporter, partial [Verrucomicrobiota bacterium]